MSNLIKVKQNLLLQDCRSSKRLWNKQGAQGQTAGKGSYKKAPGSTARVGESVSGMPNGNWWLGSGTVWCVDLCNWTVRVSSGSFRSFDCRGHGFVFRPSCFRREYMKGKTGESLGRLKAKHTAAFQMSCRAAWSVTTEGAAVTWATDGYIWAHSLAGRGEAGLKAWRLGHFKSALGASSFKHIVSKDEGSNIGAKFELLGL